MKENMVSLNEFYTELGMECTEMGFKYGWNIDDGLIEVRFTSTITDDNKLCLVVSFARNPRLDFDQWAQYAKFTSAIMRKKIYFKGEVSMENYNEYKEMLMNDMDLTGVDLDSIDDFVKETVDEINFNEMTPDEILENTGKDALLAAGLIAAGLAVTYVTSKYVVPFAMKKVREFKQKREQAKFERELTMNEEQDNEQLYLK